MGMRRGADYLSSLDDGRQVYIDGELVTNVVRDPRFAGGAETVARLYDLQNAPEHRDTLSYVSPSSGDRVGIAFLQPKSVEELRARGVAFRIIMDDVYGMFGRSPDFVNVAVATLASASSIFGTSPYGHDLGQNMRDYYEYVRENDLALTHVQVNPQVDRSKAVAEQSTDIALQVTRETADGFFVSGAKLVGTLSQLANELLVLPSVVVAAGKDSDRYALSFALPLNSAGIRIMSRPSVAAREAGHPLDYPLSGRLDEGDAVIIFDDVFVPWERCFIYKDPARCTQLFRETHLADQLNHQSVIRALAKSEFIAGLLCKLATSTNADSFLNVQNEVARVLMVVETLRSHIFRAENEAVKTAFGTYAPSTFPLLSAQNFYYEHFDAMIAAVRSLGAGGIVAVPSYAELAGPAGDLVERYYASANHDAEERIRLYRMAADLSMSAFAGRQQLYERFYQGDPIRRAGQYYMIYPKERLVRLVDAALEDTAARLGGKTKSPESGATSLVEAA